MNPLFVSILAIVMQAAAAPAPRSSGSSAAPRRTESFSDRYAVLSDHNIFLKDRSQRPARSASATTQAAQKIAEQSLVLKGIVLEDEGFRAYVEDTVSQKIIRLGPGDSIGRGKVSQVQIDGLSYDQSGTTARWLEVGQDFTGQWAATMPSETSSVAENASASTQPTGPAINPNDPNLTLEQKLKLRRMQELKH